MYQAVLLLMRVLICDLGVAASSQHQQAALAWDLLTVYLKLAVCNLRYL